MRIEMDVTSEMIEFVIAEFIEEGKRVHRAMIEKAIRELLLSDGCIHFKYRIQEHSDETLEKAAVVAEALYPDFY